MLWKAILTAVLWGNASLRPPYCGTPPLYTKSRRKLLVVVLLMTIPVNCTHVSTTSAMVAVFTATIAHKRGRLCVYCAVVRCPLSRMWLVGIRVLDSQVSEIHSCVLLWLLWLLPLSNRVLFCHYPTVEKLIFCIVQHLVWEFMKWICTFCPLYEALCVNIWR